MMKLRQTIPSSMKMENPAAFAALLVDNEVDAAEEAVLHEESGFVRIAICRSADSDQL